MKEKAAYLKGLIDGLGIDESTKEGKVIKATPIAGDCIVEIQFDRVGVKKTMANYAPLKKLTEE